MIFKWLAAVLAGLQIIGLSSSEPMVQLFDVKEEKVVDQRSLTPNLEQAVIDLLETSPSVYTGIDMNPQSGVILHIQFTSPVYLSSRIYSGAAKEVYLYLEPGEKPRAVVFLATTDQYVIVTLDKDSDAFIKDHRWIRTKTSGF
ncbi:hypothetical protein [Paenibacillus ihbetae]|uniref:Uncharacterized protein n=1 Tax=Paenibacillus ihbetae TaxID=1870820 RepID=A0ABX3JZF1_9BACL|nr:hypothetical protein [Paenibacillus ihbetae]OOC62550.1 hypothetical protein BBD40_12165 [Paenibacillus ihbetae]